MDAKSATLWCVPSGQEPPADGLIPPPQAILAHIAEVVGQSASQELSYIDQVVDSVVAHLQRTPEYAILDDTQEPCERPVPEPEKLVTAIPVVEPADKPGEEVPFNAYMERHTSLGFMMIYSVQSMLEEAKIRLSRRFCRQIADDACDKTWGEYVTRSLSGERVPTDIDLLRPWVHCVANHAAIDEWRRRYRHRTVPLPHADALADESTAEPDEMIVTLLEEIDLLPEKLRREINAFYFDDMTGKQAAEMLGISHDTFRGRLVVARNMLREKLSDRF